MGDIGKKLIALLLFGAATGLVGLAVFEHPAFTQIFLFAVGLVAVILITANIAVIVFVLAFTVGLKRAFDEVIGDDDDDPVPVPVEDIRDLIKYGSYFKLVVLWTIGSLVYFIVVYALYFLTEFAQRG